MVLPITLVNHDPLFLHFFATFPCLSPVSSCYNPLEIQSMLSPFAQVGVRIF
jgi:hypothetical protein